MEGEPLEDLKIEELDSPLGSRIFKLDGPLTIRTLFDFQDAARRAVSQPVVLDLSGVPYMDSAGLGCLISVFTSCQRDNRGFGIVGVADRIRTLFQVTHVDGLLPCFASTEAADAAITKP
jgi:anti-sigma B factor antagonist